MGLKDRPREAVLLGIEVVVEAGKDVNWGRNYMGSCDMCGGSRKFW